MTGKFEEASATVAQMRGLVEADWARRRGRRGRTAAAAEGVSYASLVVMEVLEGYIAAARVRNHVVGTCRDATSIPVKISLQRLLCAPARCARNVLSRMRTHGFPTAVAFAIVTCRLNAREILSEHLTRTLVEAAP